MGMYRAGLNVELDQASQKEIKKIAALDVQYAYKGFKIGIYRVSILLYICNVFVSASEVSKSNL